MIVLKIVIGLWMLGVYVHPLTIVACPITYQSGGPVVSGTCITWHSPAHH